MEFSHPLARAAKIWSLKSVKGPDQNVLVIVTTMALDAESKSYKPKLVERLTTAARDYLATSEDATSFVLVNRLREWHTRQG